MKRRTAFVLARAFGVVAAHVAAGSSFAGEFARLDVALADGSAAVVVPPGGTFNARVAVAAPPGTFFNAALFRVIFTTEGCQVIDYAWHAPFVTGGITDFSLQGLTLPVTVNDPTLSGPGYPIDTADVEFGNFDFFLASGGGALMDLVLRAPVDAKPGMTFIVVAYPDAFSDGFAPVSVDVGLVLTVEIANSSVFGDISGDGLVNSVDLAILLGNWGGSGIGDINSDGVVDAVDIAILLGAWKA